MFFMDRVGTETHGAAPEQSQTPSTSKCDYSLALRNDKFIQVKERAESSGSVCEQIRQQHPALNFGVSSRPLKWYF